MLNLAEELLLLALQDEKGTVLASAADSLPYGLAGALLMELALRSRIQFDQKNLAAVDLTTIGDDLLDEALEIIGQSKRNRNPQYWVTSLSTRIKNLQGRLQDRLVQKGILKHEEHRVLGIFRTQRYPAEDTAVEQSIKDRLRSTVFAGAPLEPHFAALISLVSACGLIDEIFSREERKRARQRIKEITQRELIGKAVSETVAGVQAAVIVAIAAAATAVSSSSSNSG